MWEKKIIAKTMDYLKDQWSDKVGNRRYKNRMCLKKGRVRNGVLPCDFYW
jgi:hypothetical protein